MESFVPRENLLFQVCFKFHYCESEIHYLSLSSCPLFQDSFTNLMVVSSSLFYEWNLLFLVFFKSIVPRIYYSKVVSSSLYPRVKSIIFYVDGFFQAWYAKNCFSIWISCVIFVTSMNFIDMSLQCPEIRYSKGFLSSLFQEWSPQFEVYLQMQE